MEKYAVFKCCSAHFGGTKNFSTEDQVFFQIFFKALGFWESHCQRSIISLSPLHPHRPCSAFDPILTPFLSFWRSFEMGPALKFFCRSGKSEWEVRPRGGLSDAEMEERAGERAFREFFNGFPPPALSSFELPARCRKYFPGPKSLP